MEAVLAVAVLTTVVSGVLAALVLQRWYTRGRKPHLLLWGTGLSLYFLAGLMEVILAFGWSDVAFRLW